MLADLRSSSRHIVMSRSGRDWNILRSKRVRHVQIIGILAMRTLICKKVFKKKTTTKWLAMLLTCSIACISHRWRISRNRLMSTKKKSATSIKPPFEGLIPGSGRFWRIGSNVSHFEIAEQLSGHLFQHGARQRFRLQTNTHMVTTLEQTNNFFFQTFPKNSLNGTNCTMSRRAGSPQVERIGVSSASNMCIFTPMSEGNQRVVSLQNLGKIRISDTDNHNRNGHVIFANNLIDAGLQIIQHSVSQQHQNLISLSVLFKKTPPFFQNKFWESHQIT